MDCIREAHILMQNFRRRLMLWLVTAVSLGLLAHAQDAPSLGDAARKARQQKQESKDTKAGPAAKKPHVITDEEVLHSAPGDQPAAAPASASSEGLSTPAPAGKLSAEEWRTKIQSQKESVTTLQSGIDELNKSIQFAPGNCVSGCVQWNEKQMQKQQQVDRMQQELKQQQKQLEDMQETARQQGYGSSVGDP